MILLNEDEHEQENVPSILKYIPTEGVRMEMYRKFNLENSHKKF